MSLIDTSPSILIVDDNSLNLDLLCRILDRANFNTMTATDGTEAIAAIEHSLPKLILLDVMMPKLDGFETCKILRDNPLTRNIPIIFMTALTDLDKKIKAFKLGGNDYITKPFHKAELLVRVESQLRVLDLNQILAKQNDLLQQEIHRKYEAEISLLDSNERLQEANQSLQLEIENRKAMGLRLQAEIVDRKKAEKRVRQSLQEKDLLLKEIHHRVKNNLFIVSSLLESQADYIKEPQVLKILDNSQNRIMSMALIHEQLHSSVEQHNNNSLCKIDFQLYLTTLTEHLIDSIFAKQIELQADIQQVYLNIETAQPCGLIVNELVSNAIEHAFPNTNTGVIVLSFTQDYLGNNTLVLKDNGIGFPADKDFFQTESLGLELVTTLVEQLEGTIVVNSDRGTEITISFRELDYQVRF